MKTKYLLLPLLVLFFILLVACVQQVPTCPDANQNGICDTAEPAEEPVVEENQEPEIEIGEEKAEEPEPVVVSPEPVIEEPAEETPAETLEPVQPQQIQDLLEKFNQKVKSYSYVHGDKKFSILGDRIRVELGSYGKINSSYAFNSIYIDRAAQRAVAYCEGTRNIAQRICGEHVGPFAVDFKQYHEKTPVDWLLEYKYDKPVNVEWGQQVVQSRRVDLWVFEKAGTKIEMLIDTTYAFPLRVTLIKGDKSTSYSYTQVFVNNVKPETFEGKFP
ncbi:hypothetical protein HYS48_02565 [Candidatus Woesearchaeota archaeon]|nr:hypothetical protein [Candidatus Woesearchaeota archaeon]